MGTRRPPLMTTTTLLFTAVVAPCLLLVSVVTLSLFMKCFLTLLALYEENECDTIFFFRSKKNLRIISTKLYGGFNMSLLFSRKNITYFCSGDYSISRVNRHFLIFYRYHHHGYYSPPHRKYKKSIIFMTH